MIIIIGSDSSDNVSSDDCDVAVIMLLMVIVGAKWSFLDAVFGWFPRLSSLQISSEEALVAVAFARNWYNPSLISVKSSLIQNSKTKMGNKHVLGCLDY